MDTIIKNNNGWTMGALPEITPEIQQAARHAILIIEERMTPANTDGIKAAILTLLTHFYVGNMRDTVHQAIATDWLNCLKEFPASSIEWARLEWLKQNNKKPYPNDIRKLCMKAGSKDNALKIQCERILDAVSQEENIQQTDEQREDAKNRVSDIVRGIKGFGDGNKEQD